MQKDPSVLIITGPTASGKTDLAEAIARRLDGEIVNADVGQFYTALSVGTAKPDWRRKPFLCHLFDILDKPEDLSVASYRSYVTTLINDIHMRGKLPIIIGGSLFYIKSLFFPPNKLQLSESTKQQEREVDFEANNIDLWDVLKEIDPKRAKAVHPNDRYRVTRALQIWQRTGNQPSSLAPIFTPFFPAQVIFLTPDKNMLDQRIAKRTQRMIEFEGWIDEAKSLLGSEWEAFLERKGMIGYTQIFSWLKTGKDDNSTERNKLIALIAQETRQYAKRQIVFLKKFKQDLEMASINPDPEIVTSLITNVDSQTIETLVRRLLTR